jgi:amino acid transporter
MGLRDAVFIGIGSTVGAGIFTLFGQAGAVAGSAVWVSFLIGGIVAAFQSYSFAKLGARFPSAGGQVTWIVLSFGDGLFTGGAVVLYYLIMLSIIALVASSFGNYAASLLFGVQPPQIWINLFSSVLIVVLTWVNIVGAKAVSRVQTIVVNIVLFVLIAFVIAMLFNINPALLAPAAYPPFGKIVASVALTFFSYLGFGTIAFTGDDLKDPAKNMPRAMYIAVGFVAMLYIALSFGVFGILTVDEVIAQATTALAAAAQPIFGNAGYTLISIAALFATAGGVNTQLYASVGASFTMAKDGFLSPRFAKERKRGGTQGLIITALVSIVLVNFLNVGALATLSSSVALGGFVLLTIGHLRLASQTRASLVVLYLALIVTLSTLLVYWAYTLQTDLRTFIILHVFILLAWVAEAIWRRISHRRFKNISE